MLDTELPYDPAIPLLEKGTHLYVHSKDCTQVSKGTLFRRGTKQNAHQGINTMWPTHTMECFSALNKNGAQSHTAAQMSLRNLMPNEGSQSLKSCTEWFYLYEISRKGESMKTKSRLVLASGWKGRWGQWYLLKCFLSRMIKKLWNWSWQWLHNSEYTKYTEYTKSTVLCTSNGETAWYVNATSEKFHK